jgi:hypothetical protein
VSTVTALEYPVCCDDRFALLQWTPNEFAGKTLCRAASHVSRGVFAVEREPYTRRKALVGACFALVHCSLLAPTSPMRLSFPDSDCTTSLPIQAHTITHETGCPVRGTLLSRAAQERNRSSELRADIRKLYSHPGLWQNMPHNTLSSEHHT